MARLMLLCTSSWHIFGLPTDAAARQAALQHTSSTAPTFHAAYPLRVAPALLFMGCLPAVVWTGCKVAVNMTQNF